MHNRAARCRYVQFLFDSKNINALRYSNHACRREKLCEVMLIKVFWLRSRLSVMIYLPDRWQKMRFICCIKSRDMNTPSDTSIKQATNVVKDSRISFFEYCRQFSDD